MSDQLVGLLVVQEDRDFLAADQVGRDPDALLDDLFERAAGCQ